MEERLTTDKDRQEELGRLTKMAKFEPVEPNDTVDPFPKSQDPWQHRSEHMRCESCMAYAPKTKLVGRCRAKPPTMRGYPVVYPDKDWCLSHKLDEAWVARQARPWALGSGIMGAPKDR